MKNILLKLIQSPRHYALFLNTLSLLEYIGARKILKSQPQETLNDKLLAHITEELRHAQVLKNAALKLAPTLCETYAPEALLCGSEARYYIQKIDHAAAQQFGEQDPWRSYLYTTWLIESRATSFYALFETVLQELNKPAVFRGILVEEHRHLDEIMAWLEVVPNHAPILETLKKLEKEEFSNFLAAINKVLDHELTPA